MNATTAMRLAVMVTPRAARQRMSEEWRADLVGCAELGLSTTAIARGALRAACTARVARITVVLLRTLARFWTLPTGLVLGAACAILDIPVLVVVALASVLHGGAVAAACWRSRAPELDASPAEPSR